MYEEYQGNNPRLAKASLICGFISIGLAITGVLAIPVGAVGCLFSNMSSRKNTPKLRTSSIGLGVSLAGMFAGIFITIFSVITIWPSIKSGELLREYESIYKAIYGEEFSLEDYGINTDGFNSLEDFLNNSNVYTR